MSDGAGPHFEVRRVQAAETYPLRRAVLRPGMPPENSVYPGDEATDSAHWGAFLEGEIVGTASVYPEAPPAIAPAAGARPGRGEAPEGIAAGLALRTFRLRGMTTAPAIRRRGFGGALLVRVMDHVRTLGGGTLWFHAWAEAVPFYGTFGFELVGDEYDVSELGRFRLMRRGLAAAVGVDGHVPLAEAKARILLRADGKRFATAFTHGTLLVEAYAPRGTDPQEPHTRDEVYVVARGRGRFAIEGARSAVQPGDFLFAPAGVAHRFEDFTDDFAVWVLFYGPEGGEGRAR